jgi:hypothetical protein
LPWEGRIVREGPTKVNLNFCHEITAAVRPPRNLVCPARDFHAPPIGNMRAGTPEVAIPAMVRTVRPVAVSLLRPGVTPIFFEEFPRL